MLRPPATAATTATWPISRSPGDTYRHGGRSVALVAVLILAASVAAAASALTGPLRGPRLLDFPAGARPHAAAAGAVAALDRAVVLPGSGALNLGLGDVRLTSGACPSRGPCILGGAAGTAGGDDAPVVVVGRGARWRRARLVPGTGRANADGGGSVDAVACTARSTCLVAGTVAGTVTGASLRAHPFLSVVADGRWGGTTFLPVPRLAAATDGASVSALACGASACALAGTVTDAAGTAVGSFAASWRAGTVTVRPLPSAFVPEAATCDDTCTIAGAWSTGAVGGAVATVAEVSGRWVATVDRGADLSGVDGLACGPGGCAVAVCDPRAGGVLELVHVADRRWGRPSGLAVTGCTGPPAEPVGVTCAGQECSVLADGGTLLVAVRRGQVVARRHYPLPPVRRGLDGEASVVACTAPGDCVGEVALDAAVVPATPVDGLATEHAGHWGNERPIPGLAGVPWAANGTVTSVACASLEACAAGGWYTDAAGATQAFLTDRTKAGWAPMQPLAAVVAWNVGRDAEITQVACGGPASCDAIGTYLDGRGHVQSFVDHLGPLGWGAPSKVPDVGLPGVDGWSSPSGLSLVALDCSGPGDCVALGDARDGGGSSGVSAAVTVGELDGRWGHPTIVDGQNGPLDVAACWAQQSCEAVGEEFPLGQGDSADALDRQGDWIGGTVAAGAAASVSLTQLSCATLGPCAAVGEELLQPSGRVLAVVDTLRVPTGSWARPAVIPDSGSLSSAAQEGAGGLESVACAARSVCVATGAIVTDGFGAQAVASVLLHGAWSPLTRIAGLSSDDVPLFTPYTNVACAPSGRCVLAATADVPRGGVLPALVAVSATGISRPLVVAGSALAGPATRAVVDSVSCGSDGACTLAGSLTTRGFGTEPFVATYTRAALGRLAGE